MTIWILAFLSLLLVLDLLLVVGIAEFCVHPPKLRRPCDTDGMALHVAAVMGANATLVKLNAPDGTALSAWWLEIPSVKAALLCHGVADTSFGVMGAALMFLQDGYSVLAPDNRGQGGSDGFVTYGVKESEDIGAWQAWLTNQGITECIGFGESLGASSLLQSLQAGAKFTQIIVECPYSTFPRVAWDRVFRVVKHALPKPLARAVSSILVEEMLTYLRLRYKVDLHLARPIDALQNLEVPILLIHGTGDFETPIHHSQELAATNPAKIELWLVPGAQHTGAYAVEPAEYERRVTRLRQRTEAVASGSD